MTIACSNTRPELRRKRSQLAGLAGERLDDPHPGDVLLGVGGELADALLHLLDRGPRAAAVAVGDDHDERHRRQRDQAQLGVDHDHHDAGEHDREDRLQDEHEPVAEEEAHGLEVHGGARHQLTGLLVVEEAELQALQVAVDPLAQVVFDVQRDPPGDHPPPVHGPPTHEHHGEDHQRKRQQRVAIVCAQRLLVLLGVVGAVVDRFHGAPGEGGERDGHHHREAGEDPGDGQPAPVGAQEAEQSVEGRHSCLVNHYCRVHYSALVSPDPSTSTLRGRPAAGLCDSCAFQRVVPNTRGSVFSLCNRSREDPAYPRYPRLPVRDCPGYERRE